MSEGFMMRFLILAGMAAVAVAAPSAAKKPEPADRDKQVVCRRGNEAALGSHFARPRVCRTRAEWREVEANTDRELREYRDRNTATAPSTATTASPQ
jgi:hypothetical protein